MIREILIYIAVYLGLFVGVYYLLSFLGPKTRTKEIPEDKLPFVSVLIPAYNEEKSIMDTIKSILDSDYPGKKFEVLVIDDGSTDKTYEEAKKIRDNKLRIYTKTNGGKATALNFGIKKARGEIIFTMDADTFAEKDAMKKMVKKFAYQDVMAVAPSMVIYKPKGVLQRIQQIEYLMGVYLRKAFGNMNAIHITPGAFTAYRKSFFNKHGDFEVGNITEDMEMALRIQFHDFIIKSEENAIVYTKSPNSFLPLLKQRRRWYFGLTKNLWKYRTFFSRKYGELGVIVLPVAVISVFLAIILTSYTVVTFLIEIKKDILLLKDARFDLSYFAFNKYVLERFIFSLFSRPIFLFMMLLILVLIVYLSFAKRKVKKYTNVGLSLVFFLLAFTLLFVFWWIISLFYIIFIGKISWGKK